jgi:hypothetical protein
MLAIQSAQCLSAFSQLWPKLTKTNEVRYTRIRPQNQNED